MAIPKGGQLLVRGERIRNLAFYQCVQETIISVLIIERYGIKAAEIIPQGRVILKAGNPPINNTGSSRNRRARPCRLKRYLNT